MKPSWARRISVPPPPHVPTYPPTQLVVKHFWCILQQTSCQLYSTYWKGPEKLGHAAGEGSDQTHLINYLTIHSVLLCIHWQLLNQVPGLSMLWIVSKGSACVAG